MITIIENVNTNRIDYTGNTIASFETVYKYITGVTQITQVGNTVTITTVNTIPQVDLDFITAELTAATTAIETAIINMGSGVGGDFKATRTLIYLATSVTENDNTIKKAWGTTTEKYPEYFLWFADNMKLCRKIRFDAARQFIYVNYDAAISLALACEISGLNLDHRYVEGGVDGISQGDTVIGLLDFVNSVQGFETTGLYSRIVPVGATQEQIDLTNANVLKINNILLLGHE